MKHIWFAFLCSVGLASGHGGGALASDAEKLPQTENVVPMVDACFSLAPDGRSMVFSIEGTTPFDPKLVLYDVEHASSAPIALSPEARVLAARGQGPLSRAGCWDADGARVVLPSDATLFVLNVPSTAPTWQVVERPSPAELRRYYECRPATEQSDLGVRAISEPSGISRIVDASGKELARHRPRGSAEARTQVGPLALSHDARFVAYAVTEYSGSLASPAEGWVVALAGDAPPRSLGKYVLGPFRWDARRSVLYGCKRRGSRDRGIYRWEIS